MKILRIVSSSYEQGGVENGIVLTNKILRARGHEVKTVASDYRPDMPHFGDWEFAHIPERGVSKIINGTWNFSAHAVTKKALREFQPDVVLLHTLSQPTPSVLVLLKNYPTVYFIHGPEIFIKKLLPWSLPKDAYKHGNFERSDLTVYGKLRFYYFRYVLGALYKTGLRNVDQIIALSSYTKKILLDEGYKAKYIPNGAKLRSAKSTLHKKPVILYVGRLEKFKGVDDLVKAMPAIIAKLPNARLHIVGDGSYAKELKKLATKIGVAETVKFYGYVGNKKLEYEYRNCSLFILPSTWPETFGKVGVEAMSAGKPVVATDVGGVRDWLRDGQNGFVVPPGNPDQLAEKIIKILSDKKLAVKMSKNAVETSKEFSIEKMAVNIEKIIKPYQTKQ